MFLKWLYHFIVPPVVFELSNYLDEQIIQFFAFKYGKHTMHKEEKKR